MRRRAAACALLATIMVVTCQVVWRAQHVLPNATGVETDEIDRVLGSQSTFAVLSLDRRGHLTDASVKRAFRRASKRVHPDRVCRISCESCEAAQRAQLCIVSARDELLDPTSRAAAQAKKS